MESNQVKKLPTIIITGASGFIGRNLLDDLATDHRIFAIARRSPQECKAPVHPNIAWIRADVGDWDSISRAFREIATAGGAEMLIHLAAYYDFSGKNDPEYQRTNVVGTRNVIKLAKDLDLKLFVFVSSVAACSFPKKNESVDENSPPDGMDIYSRSKRDGEKMVLEDLDELHACIVRFGAVFSDWCEYPPLYALLNSWLTTSWKSRLLAGKGMSALPYIHIRDIISFFRKLLKNYKSLVDGKILLACRSGSTPHKILFEASTHFFYGKAKRPLMIPKIVTGIGIYLTNLFGKPFERPWMWRYIDKMLNVENKKTCELLNWSSSPRLNIEKRIPFLVERFKSEPFAWQSRNLAILKKTTLRPSFCIYNALLEKEDEIVQQVLTRIYASGFLKFDGDSKKIDESELIWQIKLIYKLLITSIHTDNKLLIQNYFEVSGINRFKSGYDSDKINFILNTLSQIATAEFSRVDTLKSFKKEIYDFITLPLNFAIDEVELQYQHYLSYQREEKEVPESAMDINQQTARDLLEETIWKCLVHRK
ncbi:MAG: NAD(P)-dependent oxidoreductase [Calditrichia bacterium]|nr:NAD(P)-dependent oxidoreductase [Calditrichia bacterium]